MTATVLIALSLLINLFVIANCIRVSRYTRQATAAATQATATAARSAATRQRAANLRRSRP